MIEIEKLTVGEARKIASMFSQQLAKPDAVYPFIIGEKYFIRTVTHHHTGILVAATERELVLSDAAWIAEDGRLTDALKTGDFNEVEMFPPGHNVIIGRASLIDACAIPMIPTSQK